MSDQTNETKSDHTVAEYRWQPPSAIACMRVESIAGGRVRCRLWASEDAPKDSLQQLPTFLSQNGYSHVYPDVTDHENVLVVDRLPKADKLIHTLSRSGYISGTATLSKMASYDAQHNMLQKAYNSIKGDTIKWSGRIGLLGHGSMFLVGLIKHDRKTMLGATGAINPIILSVYGNGKSEIDFDQMMDKMMAYFRAEGLELTDDNRYRQPRTLAGGVNQLLATYPLQVGHGLGCIGAYNNISSGLGQYRAGNKEAMGLATAGATSLLGNLLIMFVPETKKDRDDEKSVLDSIKYGASNIDKGILFTLTQPHRVPGKLWDFVKDSPLRANGLLNASDNVLMIVHTFGQFKQQKLNPATYGGLLKQAGVGQNLYRRIDNATPYMWMTTAFSWGMATFLSTISSKHRGSDYLQDEMFEPMYAAAAKFLIQVPESDRDDVMRRMANYLADQEEVKDGKISVEKIVAEVEKRIDTISQSLWVQKATETKSAANNSTAALSRAS